MDLKSYLANVVCFVKPVIHIVGTHRHTDTHMGA